LIQTDVFNKWALDFTLEKLNESIYEDAKINARELDGNVLTGLTLKDGSITVKEDTLMRFNYIETKYNVWKLIDKEIRLERLILNSPYINAHKIKDSTGNLVWNYENIFLPSPDEPDTISGEFDWDINVEYFKLENGFIRINGDTTLTPLDPYWKTQRPKTESFDIYNTDISNFEMEFGGKYFRNEKNISIHNISFATNSDFVLKHLEFEVMLNEKDSVTDLKNLDLVTGRSEVRINKLNADKFNPFGEINYTNFGDMNVDVDLDIKKFNFDDLVYFLPYLDFLDSTASLKLAANGKYGNLDIKELALNLSNSQLYINGKVQNLHDPENLYFDVSMENFNIDPRDVKSVYKDDAVPDYSQLAPVKGSIKYKGTYLSFTTAFDINTSGGFAGGNVTLDIEKESYNGYITTNSLNLGKVLKDNGLSSNLNSAVKFSGRGFDPRYMNTSFEYTVTGSRFTEYDIRHSSGKINFVRNNIGMDIKYASSMGIAAVTGKVNIANTNNLSYNLKGSVKNFDLSRVTKNSEDKSDLNLAFNVNGNGTSLENINGKYIFDIDRSHYGGYDIPATLVDAEIENSGENGNLLLTNEMLEIKANGNFGFKDIGAIIVYNIEQLNKYIEIAAGSDSAAALQTINSSGVSGNLNVTYSLITKDSTKLRHILTPFGVSFNGNISGTITNDDKQFKNISKLNVRDFSYGDTTIILKNVIGNIEFENNYSSSGTGAMFNGMDIIFNTTAEKISLGGNSFDSAIVALSIADEKGKLKVSGRQDSTNFADLTGDLEFAEDNISLDMDSVRIIYAGFDIQNEDNWILDYYPNEKVDIEQLDLKSKNAVVKVNGLYSFYDQSDIIISSHNLNIADVMQIIRKADSTSYRNKSLEIDGEFTTLEATFKGTAETPVLTATMESNTLRYEDTDIGVIKLIAEYKEDKLNADIMLTNSKGRGKLNLKADIPYANPLSSDTTLRADLVNSNVDISLTAKDFVLDYYTLFIPSVSSLRGDLNAELYAKGTTSDPGLQGTLSITDGSYMLPLTGMDYSFDVKMSTAASRLVLENLKIFNEDDPSRHIDLSGTLDFKDLKIKDIDLAATGDMVLLDTEVEENDLGIYGYLLGGIGSPQIKITGSLDSLFISGQLLVKEANITSLPLEGKGYNPEEDNFVYVNSQRDTNFIVDTTIAISEEDYAVINPFERYKYYITEEIKTKSIMGLDLNVKTVDNVYVNIDFNNITQDRLFGDIEADIDLKTVGGEYHAFGTVNVVGNSYYRFYRDFKTRNSSLKFDGPISNPLLDIKAVYEDQKTTEVAGVSSTSDISVEVTITGEVKKPDIRLKLYQDGTEVTGSDAQSDAITYLIFGRFKSELNAAERTAVASSLGTGVGSLYISSYLSQSIREVLPFIVDAEFKYTEGSVNDADIELQSVLGDARISFGGKLLKEDRTIEVVVQYPLNRLLNLDLPETLLLEFAREEKKQVLGNNEDILTTEIKLLYKIKF
jgi:hypothetical protein